MYLQHFGMQEFPFRLTPDTSFFYCHQSQAEAMNVLMVALTAGEGFLKITGEVGTGKTMLCRKLLNLLEEQGYVTAYIPDPFLSPSELRQALATELHMRPTKTDNQHKLMLRISKKLIGIRAKGKPVVLLIDEAQSMPLETLETLRLITNLETEKDKLLQIVLFGQPELDELLKQKEIRQLRQRISFSYYLKPMDKQTITQYIQHRLHVAGYAQNALFNAASLALITKASRGIPRLVNLLSHKALLTAYGKGEHHIGKRQIMAAIRDTEDTQFFEQKLSILWIPVTLLLFAALIAALNIGIPG